MLTAGILATFLVRWLGAGTVRNYKVRFTGQVWPGETLVCGGRVTEVAEHAAHRIVTCELWVKNSEGDPKLTGNATCALPLD